MTSVTCSVYWSCEKYLLSLEGALEVSCSVYILDDIEGCRISITSYLHVSDAILTAMLEEVVSPCLGELWICYCRFSN